LQEGREKSATASREATKHLTSGAPQTLIEAVNGAELLKTEKVILVL
jgi:hypothetical protein